MPGSSINSWDSWFIFNLRKINTCYCTTQYVHRKRWRGWYEKVHVRVSININLKCWSSSNACNQVEIPLYYNAHVLSNVHTWASFFLRHLASTSFMVPFWASTDSGSVPISGSRVRSHDCPEEVVYRLNDSCSHFTQRLFPLNVP